MELKKEKENPLHKLKYLNNSLMDKWIGQNKKL